MIEEHRLVGGSKVMSVTGALPELEQKEGLLEPEEYETEFDISPYVPIMGDNVRAGDTVQPVESLITRMGGKNQLKTWLVQHFPRGQYKVYVEPFGGSFQVLLWKPWIDSIEIINDIDADLVHFFRYVRFDGERLAQVINAMPTHEAMLIGFRRELAVGSLSGLERAAAYYMAYSSSFNGMMSTLARYASSPYSLINTKVDKFKLARVANRLDRVDIRSTDVWRVIASANKPVEGGVFFYLDPPYDDTTGYETYKDKSTFGRSDQKRLADCCADIHLTGNRFIQTNSATRFLKELYGGYKNEDGTPMFHIKEVDVKYVVSGKASARREHKEFVISNFPIEEAVKKQRRMF